jgi:hypothetical protein
LFPCCAGQEEIVGPMPNDSRKVAEEEGACRRGGAADRGGQSDARRTHFGREYLGRVDGLQVGGRREDEGDDHERGIRIHWGGCNARTSRAAPMIGEGPQ